jgi:hypothetical protein
MGSGFRCCSVLRALRVDAEQDPEVAALGVVAPQDVGDVVGMVVSVGRDAAADRRMPDVDAPTLDTRPTGSPSRPKRRAMAAPRFGPAPAIAMDMGPDPLVLARRVADHPHG